MTPQDNVPLTAKQRAEYCLQRADTWEGRKNLIASQIEDACRDAVKEVWQAGHAAAIEESKNWEKEAHEQGFKEGSKQGTGLILEIGRKVRQDALEEAAKVVENFDRENVSYLCNGDYLERLASKIRALKEKK